MFTGAGDVTIHMSEAPDAGVIIDGDGKSAADKLEAIIEEKRRALNI